MFLNYEFDQLTFEILRDTECMKVQNSPLTYFLNLLKYENSQHIQYLTHENFELKNKLTEFENESKSSNEKICNLEHCCTQLEIQLTETIKVFSLLAKISTRKI